MEAISLDRSIGLNKEARYLHQESRRILDSAIGTSIFTEQLILRGLFHQLKAKWIAETMNFSSPAEIYGNRHYLTIISIGSFLLRFILDDMKYSPNHWFHALEKITSADPIKEESVGDLLAMSNDWLAWGQEHQLI